MGTFDGKIGRAAYAGAWAVIIAASVGASIGGVTLQESRVEFLTLVGSLLQAAAVFSVPLATVLVAVLRLRDIGWTPWLALLQLVPLANLVLMAVLLATPGAGSRPSASNVAV